MIEFTALNLHWMPKMTEDVDLCAHSSVLLKIGGRVVSDENSGDWTVSSSAYYLLKSLKLDHISQQEASQLLPCCGFNFWLAGDQNDELLIMGCQSGIDWTIQHEKNLVIHKFEDGQLITTELDLWKRAVCDFSDDVTAFYQKSLPKRVEDEENRKGYDFFLKEWQRLRTEADYLGNKE